MGKLTELPAGAGYSNRSGQANVHLKRTENGDIEVTATCDSLARVVLLQQEELERIRSETDLREIPPNVIREPTGWQWFWIRTGQMAVACSLLWLSFRYLLKRFK